MNAHSPRAEIPQGRQTLYYGGMITSIVGLLIFGSVFLSAASPQSSRPRPVVWVSPGSEDSYRQFCGVIGAPCDAEVHVGAPGSPGSASASQPQNAGADLLGRALLGFGLVAAGGIMMSLGAKGLRGSGVILDPEGAREDLQPWSQAAGGMLDDALGSSEITSRALENRAVERADEPPREVVRVRCLECRALNDEDAKFCDNCGAAL